VAAGIVNAFGPLQMYLQKTDSAGNLLWARTYGNNTSSSECRAIQRTDSGFVMIGQLGLGSPYPFSILKTDKNGIIGCYEYPSPSLVYNNPLSGTDAFGAAIPVNITAGKPPCRSIIHSTTEFTGCLLNSVNENTEDNIINIYPNPFSSGISIKIEKQNVKHASFIVRDIFGQPIFREEENNLNGIFVKSFNLENLASGIYFFEIIIDGERRTRKVIKI